MKRELRRMARYLRSRGFAAQAVGSALIVDVYRVQSFDGSASYAPETEAVIPEWDNVIEFASQESTNDDEAIKAFYARGTDTQSDCGAARPGQHATEHIAAESVPAGIEA